MMNRLPRLLAATLALALAAPLAAADTPPKVATTVDPGYPEELTDTGRNGNAVVKAVVRADGTVASATLESADHPAFGAAALGAVQKWTFEPATHDGRPVEKTVAIPFKFVAPVEQVLNATLHRRAFQPLPGPVLTSEQFGAELVVRRAAPPNYPRSLAGTGTSANVEVRFVVGPDGSTFNPAVLGQPPREFVVPAIAAVAHAAYEPPVKDGQPVYVETTVTLRFEDPLAPPPPAASAAPEAKSGG